MTKKFMNDPIRILVKRDEITLEGIKQFFIAVEKEEALPFLLFSPLSLCFSFLFIVFLFYSLSSYFEVLFLPFLSFFPLKSLFLTLSLLFVS